MLAPVGDCVVVEATDGDDRATFVFRTHDVARLNAVLLLTAFRREALFLPDDQLGRWAIAARLWPAVREARAFILQAIAQGATVVTGHGHGPLNHGHAPRALRVSQASA